MENTGPITAAEAADLGRQVRRDAHRLNNLLLVLQGNIDLLLLEQPVESGAFRDIMLALTECREITGRLLHTGRRLSSQSF